MPSFSMAATYYYAAVLSLSEKNAANFVGRAYSNNSGFTSTNLSAQSISYHWIAIGRWQ